MLLLRQIKPFYPTLRPFALSCNACTLYHSHIRSHFSTLCFLSSHNSHLLSLSLALSLSVFFSCSLEGKRPRRSFRALAVDPRLRFSGQYRAPYSDLYVECCITGGGNDQPLSLPTQTAYRSFSKQWVWDEWLPVPVTYCDLPRDARIEFSVYDIYAPGARQLVGRTSLDYFRDDGSMCWGKFTLKVNLHKPEEQEREWEGQAKTETETTKVCATTAATVTTTINTVTAPTTSTTVAVAASGPPESGGHHQPDMVKLQGLQKQHGQGEMVKMEWLDRLTFRQVERAKQREMAASDGMYLTVQLQQFDCPVVYCELAQVLRPNLAEGLTVMDPEILFPENLVENKHYKLLRSRRRGPLDRELKPNPAQRDVLQRVVRKSPADAISPDEKDLLWRYRFYLTRDAKALTKFLRCVDWAEPTEEAKQAEELLAIWAEIGVVDALELLSSDFRHPCVRRYAVARLRQADAEELELYLLQLVQALQYEPDSTERGFVLDHERTEGAIAAAKEEDDATQALNDSTLEGFLIKCGLENRRFGQYFSWYLLVECKDKEKKISRIYVRIWKDFTKAMEAGTPEQREWSRMLSQQRDFVAGLRNLAKEIKQSGGSRPKKIERLRAKIAGTPEFAQFEPMPLPLDPDVFVVGMESASAHVFKSAMMPLGLSFRTRSGGSYKIIFKNGDDLRQDQLILQIINLMDRLLKRENLDLQLTPYHCLATSSTHGMVQNVPSQSVAAILSKHGNIQNYLRKHNEDPSAPYTIATDAMDRYVRSCAGYCVITYLLSVGDRHLDNLLLQEDGRLFHIDFGYILGRDPKPYPPPMKITKDMVEAMGGQQSEEMRRFRSHCFSAFLILRKNANLILNLFTLMVDSNVQDIAMDRDKTVMKVQEKFLLDRDDEAAVQQFSDLLDSSVTAVFARISEAIHGWAQYWRK